MSLEVSVRSRFVAPGAEPFEVDADLAVETGETLVVLGPSGSGKTLLLETVAGYHDHEGRVLARGEDVTDEPPERRGFGYVFQDYALFPHMTIRENVAFGTRYVEDARDPDDLLAELGIAHLAERTPPTLSGGEAQRVALARSLAIRPSVVLLDEPLSALDVPTRETLRTELSEIVADVTALYVTHNRTTARELGDRIAVMRAGRVVQVGEPEAVFERPDTAFVARFTGSNCVPSSTWSGAIRASADEGVAPDSAPDGDGPPAREGSTTGSPDAGTVLAIRPEHVVVGDGGVAATVRRVTREDFGVRVALERGGSTVEAYTTSPPDVGDETAVRFPADRVTRVPDEGEDDRNGAAIDGG